MVLLNKISSLPQMNIRANYPFLCPNSRFIFKAVNVQERVIMGRASINYHNPYSMHKLMRLELTYCYATKRSGDFLDLG